MTDNPHRCGFVTLVGRPNVGKSTLLNRMLGEKVAITSSRPQTTRNRIPGVLTRPDAQIVFIDTPGIHHARRALNSYMVGVAQGAIFDTDALAILVEAGIGPEYEVGVGRITEEILGSLGEFTRPVFLVINKVDKVPHEHLLPVIAVREPCAPVEDVGGQVCQVHELRPLLKKCSTPRSHSMLLRT